MKKIIIVTVIVLIIVTLTGMFKFNILANLSGYNVDGNKIKLKNIKSFKECVDAGFPIMESFPEQCSDGESLFIKEIE